MRASNAPLRLLTTFLRCVPECLVTVTGPNVRPGRGGFTRCKIARDREMSTLPQGRSTHKAAVLFL